MGRIPKSLKETIARNIHACRVQKFPGRGGGKKCAEALSVSPQQWSPWERGMRTPDEAHMEKIAKLFGVTVEYLRRDHGKSEDADPAGASSSYDRPGAPYPALRESAPPVYGLPSLAREERAGEANEFAELALISARLMESLGAVYRGAVAGRFEVDKAITVLRRIGESLEQRLGEVDGSQTPFGRR